MDTELSEMLARAQAGDSECSLYLLDKFSPLIKKYAKKLCAEDAYEELQCHFLETINKTTLNRLSCPTDGAIIRYIEKSLLHHYIALSKKNRRSAALYIEDIHTYDLLEYDPRFGTNDEHLSLLLRDMQKVLGKTEYMVLYYLFVVQCTVLETAQKLNISRQAVYKAKNSALQKLRKEFIGGFSQ